MQMIIVEAGKSFLQLCYLRYITLPQAKLSASTRTMKATIWHNPDCGTSRKTLTILRETPGVDLTVLEYRKTPYTRSKLEQLFRDAGLTPREALRTRGSPAEELGLIDGASSDDILEAMVAHPILVERPFVETDKGVRLCRPQDKVQEIL
jgi:arsenate reductase (glutaredoxin)